MMEAPIVRDPMYRQLHQALRGLIRGGEFAAGARFLTEREVGSRYRVSRATANKALSTLVAEGVLEFRKGVGTFVRGGLDYDLRALVSFTDKARAAGSRPTTKVLSQSLIPASKLPPEAAALGRGPAVFMMRLRLADGWAVILERRWVAAARCPGLERADLKGSLYALWTERYKLRLEGAEETIRAVELPRLEAKLLGVKIGSAAFLVESTGRLIGGEPLWTERTHYRGDLYAFRNRLGGLESPRPAMGVLG